MQIRNEDGTPRITMVDVVSHRALVQRINRRLRPDGEFLRTLRGRGKYATPPNWSDLGDYYIVDEARNVVLTPHVDLEALGRERGVLMPHEAVADE